VGFHELFDDTQPGSSDHELPAPLPYPPFNNGDCDSNHWYQVNNDYPYYTTRGTIISNQDVNEFLAALRTLLDHRQSRL